MVKNVRNGEHFMVMCSQEMVYLSMSPCPKKIEAIKSLKSPTGLGVILIQHTLNKNDETVVAYGSRSLTEVEKIQPDRA